jgi:lipopolysaccharide exporter
MTTLGKRMAKGAAWMLLQRMLGQGIGLVSTVVLARLLVPADFGIVAMATSVIAILEILASFSFDWVLIQKQDAERRHYDTAWTLNILIGAGLAALMSLVAGIAAAYYREPRVEQVLYVLAIATLIGGFGNIGVVAFRKDLTLHKEFYLAIANRVIRTGTTIALAVLFRSYWALVWGIVVSRVFGVILSYIAHPFRPHLSLAGGRDLFNFSKWLLLLSLLTAAFQRAPDLIIGRMAGAAALGAYSIGLELSNLASSQVVQPVSRAVYPGYAKMAHDPDMLRSGFLAVVALVALFAVPATAGTAMVAESLVYTLLGEKWRAVIPMIHVLAPYGLISALYGSTIHLFIASGNPRIVAGLNTLRLGILIPALVLGALWNGVVGVAYGMLITAAVVLPLAYARILRLIKAQPGDYMGLLWRPALASGGMIAGLVLWQRWLDSSGFAGAYLVELVTSVCLGAAIYAAMLYLLWRLAGTPLGAEAHLVTGARAFLRGLLRTATNLRHR